LKMTTENPGWLVEKVTNDEAALFQGQMKEM
jgi:hypothetical protein